MSGTGDFSDDRQTDCLTPRCIHVVLTTIRIGYGGHNLCEKRLDDFSLHACMHAYITSITIRISKDNAKITSKSSYIQKYIYIAKST